MRSFLKYISLIFVLIILVSCNGLSSLLTTNYFEPFDDTESFSVYTGDDTTSFDDFTPEEKEALIDDYTSAALSLENDESLYEALINNPDYRDEVTTYLADYLNNDDNKPNILSKTYISDLTTYQNRALALANIEVYTHGAVGINGFDDMVFNYTSGELEGTLTQEILLTQVFGDETDPVSLKADLLGSLKAGEALNLLGDTIIDKNNPSSGTLSPDDGVLVLMTSIINSIVKLSISKDSSLTEDVVLDKLVFGILNNNFDLSIITFPQDDTSPDSNLTTMERYLGVGGALVFTATDFTIPSISLFGGDE